MLHDLNDVKIKTSIKKLALNEKGYYDLHSRKINKTIKSNYLSYVRRAANIMEEEKILNQIKKHKKVFNESIFKNINKMKNL